MQRLSLCSINNRRANLCLTGKCSGCPSAQLTTEELISATVKEHIPAIEDVILVSGVSDELIAQAKALLKNGHL